MLHSSPSSHPSAPDILHTPEHTNKEQTIYSFLEKAFRGYYSVIHIDCDICNYSHRIEKISHKIVSPFPISNINKNVFEADNHLICLI